MVKYFIIPTSYITPYQGGQYYHSHFIEGETEAEGGRVTCPRLPSKPVAEPETEPRFPESPSCALSTRLNIALKVLTRTNKTGLCNEKFTI